MAYLATRYDFSSVIEEINEQLEREETEVEVELTLKAS